MERLVTVHVLAVQRGQLHDGQSRNEYGFKSSRLSAQKYVGLGWQIQFPVVSPTTDFFRSHRSTLINVSYIKEYSNNEGGEVILSDGTHVQISKARVQEFGDFIKNRSVSPK